MRRLLSCLAIGLAVMAQPPAQAQPYPSRTLRIIVPYAPGGGTDFIARLIAQKLSVRLGQQVIVENRPGAGGNLGAEIALKAAPDGYTLLLANASYTVNPSVYKLAFDPLNDISPVIQLSQGPFVAAVHPSLPVKTLQDLVELAKRDPDRLSYGSAGNGSISHLVAEYFLDASGIRATHIPYKGTGPALADTVAGNVQLTFGSVATTLQYVKSGRLRGLAVTTAKRIPAAADLPTVDEAGYPGFLAVSWHGLLGPKGIPKQIVERLNREVSQALTDRDMEALLATDGVTPAGGTPAEFLSLLGAETARWGKIVRKAGIKSE